MFKLMKHIKEKYGNPPVIITKNGKWLLGDLTSLGKLSP